jgi:hypothetical protein
MHYVGVGGEGTTCMYVCPHTGYSVDIVLSTKGSRVCLGHETGGGVGTT